MTERQVAAWQKKIVKAALELLIEATPVDYGHARANWALGINGIPRKEFDTDFDASSSAPSRKAGSMSRQRVVGRIPQIKAYDRLYLVNSVPYMQILDEGLFVPRNPGPSSDPRPHRHGKVWVRGGFSVQAKRGIIKPVIAKLEKLFR